MICFQWQSVAMETHNHVFSLKYQFFERFLLRKNSLKSKLLPLSHNMFCWNIARLVVARECIHVHHPFKLPPGGFQHYSGFSACLHSLWTSWTKIQLQKNISCSAFWKKSKIDCFFSYFEVRIFYGCKEIFLDSISEFLMKFLFIW